MRPRKRASGRPRLLSAPSGMALTLHWLRSKCSMATLAMVFGLTPTGVSVWTQFGLLCLYYVTGRMAQAAVIWPNETELKLYARVIQTRCPDLDATWGMIDGLNLQVRESTDALEQNANYNGWLHGCFTSSLLIFTPDGCIAWYACNAPGSWHDARLGLYSGLFQRLRDLIPIGFNLVADSAFPRTDANSICPGKIIRCRKIDEEPPENPKQLRIESQAKSARQSAEWGMGSVQGVWHRLHSGELDDNMRQHRRIILVTCFRLFNFRTRTIGLNQIQTVWAKYLDDDTFDALYE